MSDSPQNNYYHTKGCNHLRGPQYPCDCARPKKQRTPPMTNNTEYEEIRQRNMKAQRRDDMVLKLLFVAMCPLLFPILFTKD